MSKYWTVEPYDSSDKVITVYCGDVRVFVDFDDITQDEADEAELLAEFISKQRTEFFKWRRAREAS